MLMITQVCDELYKVRNSSRDCRRAQLATILRMSAELRVCRGLTLTASAATATAARHLRREILDLYGIESAVQIGGGPRSASYTVKVPESAALARATGLIDARGREVAGLPTLVIGGTPGEVAAAWRGAFLAAGSISGLGDSAIMQVNCPTAEIAYALASCARRLGVVPMVRETRGVHRVVIRGHEEISTMLVRMDARDSQIEWERRWARQELQKWATLDEANAARVASAAVKTCARVREALELLGSEVPRHLAETGLLRIEHSGASLEELGRYSDPPLTKDAVAGRLRRLLEMADKHPRAAAAPRLTLVGTA